MEVGKGTQDRNLEADSEVDATMEHCWLLAYLLFLLSLLENAGSSCLGQASPQSVESSKINYYSRKCLTDLLQANCMEAIFFSVEIPSSHLSLCQANK